WRTLCENGDQDGLARGLPGLVRLLEGRSAFEEGVASLTSAREVAAGALAAELDAHRGGFLLRLGRPLEAKNLLLAALRSAQAAKNDHAIALALLRLGSAHDALGEYRFADQVLREALEMAERGNDLERRMAASSALGLVAMHRSDLVEATDTFQEALALARSLDQDTATAYGLNNLALALQRRGDYMGALPLVEESLAISRRVGDPYAMAEGLTSLGILSYALEDHAGAKDAFEESLRTYQRVGNRAKVAGAYNNLSGVLHALGDLDGAIRMVERSLAVRDEIGDRKGTLLGLHNLGNFHQAAGNHVEAMARFRQALDGARSLGHVREQVATLSSMASCALEQELRDEAWGSLQEALTLARTIEANDVLLDVLANAARAMAQDDAERALAIATTVHRHPSCLPSTKRNVAALVAALAASVSADGVRRATERAGATSLPEVVAELLSHGAMVDEPGSA
ncbi:MAG: tetratricopeptide repeat protein, partial [Trueperaceae bacterium]